MVVKEKRWYQTPFLRKERENKKDKILSTFFILFLSIPGSFSRNKSHTIIQNCKKLFQSNLSKKFIYTWQDINEFQLTINRCCSDNCPKKNLESSQESTIDSAQLLVTFTKTGLQSRNLVEQLCYKTPDDVFCFTEILLQTEIIPP